MAGLIDLVDGDSVRWALDATLDANTLPDSVIASALYAGIAVAEALRLDPEAEIREGAARQHIANALNLLTAALLAPVVPQITKEDFGDFGGYTRQAIDTAKVAESLRARAGTEIELAKGGPPPPPESSMPRLFTVARGRRGQC